MNEDQEYRCYVWDDALLKETQNGLGIVDVVVSPDYGWYVSIGRTSIGLAEGAVLGRLTCGRSTDGTGSGSMFCIYQDPAH